MITTNQKSKFVKELLEKKRFWSDPNVAWQLYESDNESVLLQRIRSNCIEREKVLEQNRLIVQNQSAKQDEGKRRKNRFASAEYFPRKDSAPEEQRGVVFRDFTPLLLIPNTAKEFITHAEFSDLSLIENERIELELEIDKLGKDKEVASGNDLLNIKVRLTNARDQLNELASFASSISLLLHLCDALNEIHETGKVHLELNLMNVGVSRSGQIKVLPSPPYRPNQQVRRRVWINDLNGEDIVSPEVRNNQSVTAASDIYCAVQTSLRYLGMRQGRKLDSGFDVSNEEFLKSTFSRVGKAERFQPVTELLTQCSSSNCSFTSVKKFKNELKQCLADQNRKRVSSKGQAVQFEKNESKVNFKPFLILSMTAILLFMIIFQSLTSAKNVDDPSGHSNGNEPIEENTAPNNAPTLNDSHSEVEAFHQPEDDQTEVDLAIQNPKPKPTQQVSAPVIAVNHRKQSKVATKFPEPDADKQQCSKASDDKLKETPTKTSQSSNGQQLGTQSNTARTLVQNNNDDDLSDVFVLPNLEFCCMKQFRPQGLTDKEYQQYERIIRKEIFISLKESRAKVSQASLLNSYRKAKAICNSDFRLELLCGFVSEKNRCTKSACEFYCKGYQSWKLACTEQKDLSHELRSISLPHRLWIREMIRYRAGNAKDAAKQKPRAIKELIDYFNRRGQYSDATPFDSIRFVTYLLSYIRTDSADSSLKSQCDMAFAKMRDLMTDVNEKQMFEKLLRKHRLLLKPLETDLQAERDTVSSISNSDAPIQTEDENAASSYGKSNDEFLYQGLLDTVGPRKTSRRQQLSKIRRKNYDLVYELNYHFEFQSVLNSYEVNQ